MDLPENPTPEQIALLAAYLKQQDKTGASSAPYGSKNYYQDKTSVVGKKVVIFKHSQKKNDYWYMRMYVGNRKYKQVSLNVKDKEVAFEKALEEWRKIQNHLDSGGEVFKITVQELMERYFKHLEQLVETSQLKQHTLNGKKTSLKKLYLLLDAYLNKSPMEIPENFLDEYAIWRRTKNWDKSRQKKKATPPSDLTINKELTDFKGFFDYCNSKKFFVREIQYPFLKINYKTSEEKNPSFDREDWWKLVMYSRSWVKKTTSSTGVKRKWNFYRYCFIELLKCLANSGLRPHEAIQLRWRDVQMKKKVVESKTTGKQREEWFAVIQVSPTTKTGRREVICPAGVFFKRLFKHYESHGYKPKSDDFVFRNIGTVGQRNETHIGDALNQSFLRKIWYEFIEDFQADTGNILTKNYTIYSCRSFFINQRLELGIPPAVVGELVGHSMATMERHYKKIAIRNMTPDLIKVNRRKLEESEFMTWDMDQPSLP